MNEREANMAIQFARKQTGFNHLKIDHIVVMCDLDDDDGYYCESIIVAVYSEEIEEICIHVPMCIYPEEKHKNRSCVLNWNPEIEERSREYAC